MHACYSELTPIHQHDTSSCGRKKGDVEIRNINRAGKCDMVIQCGAGARLFGLFLARGEPQRAAAYPTSLSLASG
jgi:hypothetical protein